MEALSSCLPSTHPRTHAICHPQPPTVRILVSQPPVHQSVRTVSTLGALLETFFSAFGDVAEPAQPPSASPHGPHLTSLQFAVKCPPPKVPTSVRTEVPKSLFFLSTPNHAVRPLSLLCRLSRIMRPASDSFTPVIHCGFLPLSSLSTAQSHTHHLFCRLWRYAYRGHT